ncbi:hypothetical protein F383_35567 [Gossypium arboreum]|uniref:Uncharacterized protein n=1 Tax=Gossypium arboreum TaxID=29729 RepID=A0A0B0N2H7_GOSAR|nr:hypothetical protein F383_35567 [Gossypium arboreum]
MAYILTYPQSHKKRPCSRPWYTDFNS